MISELEALRRRGCQALLPNLSSLMTMSALVVSVLAVIAMASPGTATAERSTEVLLLPSGGGGSSGGGGPSCGSRRAAELRAELEQMKLSALRKKAVAAGVPEAAVDAAEDSEEPGPNEAIILLLLVAEPPPLLPPADIPLGLELAAAAGPSVLVVAVANGGRAAASGLTPGSSIQAANGVAVGTVAALRELLANAVNVTALSVRHRSVVVPLPVKRLSSKQKVRQKKRCDLVRTAPVHLEPALAAVKGLHAVLSPALCNALCRSAKRKGTGVSGDKETTNRFHVALQQLGTMGSALAMLRDRAAGQPDLTKPFRPAAGRPPVPLLAHVLSTAVQSLGLLGVLSFQPHCIRTSTCISPPGFARMSALADGFHVLLTQGP